MNCREKQHGAPVRPRRTEEVARETVAGLVVEALSLRKSDDPRAWERIQQIGQELVSIATVTERELRRRRLAVALDVVIEAGLVLEVR